MYLDASKTQVNALQQELSQLRTTNLNLEQEKTEVSQSLNAFSSKKSVLTPFFFFFFLFFERSKFL